MDTNETQNLTLPVPITRFGGWGGGPGLMSEETFSTAHSVLVPLRLALSLFGVATNSVCVRTFHRMGLADSVTVLFFAQAVIDLCHVALSAADAFLSVLDLVETHLAFKGFPLQPRSVRPLTAVLARIFVLSGSHVTTFLAIQRCLCVVRPLTFRSLFTRTKTLVVLAPLVAVPFVAYVLEASQVEFPRKFVPSMNASQYVVVFLPLRGTLADAYHFLFGIADNVASQVAVTLCLVYMGYALARSAKFRQQASSATSASESATAANADANTTANTAAASKPEENSLASVLRNSKEMRVIVQVSIVCAIFIVCNLPRLAISFAQLIEPQFHVRKRYHFAVLLSWQAVFLFEHFNASVNIFIYTTYNTKFRQVFLGR